MKGTIESTAFARAGLLGNPSDGYDGKTLSFSFSNFAASVRLQPSDRLRIVPSTDDADDFADIQDLMESTRNRGYYGGVRLIKAAVIGFAQHASRRSQLHHRNFEISYQTNIPRNVGLAGSSAIVVAALDALAQFYDIKIERHLLASLALRVETNLLGIPAGLQDRVIQSYNGLVFMNFQKESMRSAEGLSYGKYESLDPNRLKNVYVAFSQRAGEPTEVRHQDLKQRYQNGDPLVVRAMSRFAEIAEAGKSALLNDDHKKLAQLINDNFDLRSEICEIHPLHQRMVETARKAGASAKFCGSGGAIVGTFQDASSFPTLQSALQAIDCQVILPRLTASPAF